MLQQFAVLALVFSLSFGAAAADDPDAGAFAAMDAFMTAFNDGDIEAWADSLQFPHVRMAGGRVDYYPDRGAFVTAMKTLNLARSEGWQRSTWDVRKVVQRSSDKVHVATTFSRYRKDGERYATYQSLYIVERINGRWGVRARSSFAP
jgi:2C-methyl-D-erythritol 2,4-cyclodiphosphate synthase